VTLSWEEGLGMYRGGVRCECWDLVQDYQSLLATTLVNIETTFD